MSTMTLTMTATRVVVGRRRGAVRRVTSGKSDRAMMTMAMAMRRSVVMTGFAGQVRDKCETGAGGGGQVRDR